MRVVYTSDELRCHSSEWWACFRSWEWLQALYVRQLRYVRYTGFERTPDGRVGEVQHDGRAFVREAHALPGAHDVPRVVRNALGYVERGEFDPRGPQYRFTARNVVFPAALDLVGRIVVTRGDSPRLETTTQVDVKLLGWGDTLERRIEKELRRGFAIAADLASSWSLGEVFYLRPELA